MKKKIPSVKGTRDFYPETMAVRTWMYDVIREVSESFGYQEYEGPFLEKIELYAAKSGEELVKEQAFVFPDRSGEEITLRPELTPTLARMVAEKQRQLVLPLRWWSFGPFWRYERPQRGRTREFFQWNIDLIGTNTPESDAELVAVSAEFFRRTGLLPNQVVLFVNDRRLMDQSLEALQISDKLKSGVFKLIDRREKYKFSDWEAYAKDIGLDKAQFSGLIAILENDQLWQQSDSLQRFFYALDALGVREYVQYNTQIIRGLDYYTGTVFEARDLDGGRSILGGGRYDNLVGAVGGDPLPGVGFAMGDVMASIVLDKYGCIPPVEGGAQTVMVTIFDESCVADSYAISQEIRRAGLKAACYPEPVKLQKQIKYADRIGIRWVVICGPDEIKQNTVAIKDLETREQRLCNRGDLANELSKLLAQPNPL
jgi:histidyl-tRNA synthetase